MTEAQISFNRYGQRHENGSSHGNVGKRMEKVGQQNGVHIRLRIEASVMIAKHKYLHMYILQFSCQLLGL